MKLYYVVNARMPNKKAYGIQIAKMCEAFLEAGVNLTLIIPRTRAAQSLPLKNFYKLRVDVPTVTLPCLDWYASGSLGFAVSSLIFLSSVWFLLIGKRLGGETAIIYTIDVDSFSFAPLTAIGFPVVAEMHGPKKSSMLRRYFFDCAKLIIATNSEIKKSLQEIFVIPEKKMLVEPNGVDLNDYQNMPSKAEARRLLGIPIESKVALYVGRFYVWKGLDILAEAAVRAEDITWYVVGGTEEEYKKVTTVENIPKNLRVVGDTTPDKVPLWLAAADCLLILGTRANEESYRYTSPMKAYEYFAAKRSVVVSGTPAMKSILNQNLVTYYEPDDAASLSLTARKVIDTGGSNQISSAYAEAEAHSWSARASNILKAGGV